MLDLILAQYTSQDTAQSTVDEYLQIAIFVFILVAMVSAIVSACRHRKHSSTASADLVLAVFSPIVYWVLFAFKCVSHA